MSNEYLPIRVDFFNQIKRIISEARESSIRTVDFHRVLMYWNIGKTIFEEEQEGKDRAECGKYLIKIWL